MEFQSQAELLRYFGKNENDRNQVKRWVRDGLVTKDGKFYIVEDWVDLWKKNKKSEWVEEVEEKVVEKSSADGGIVSMDDKELNELRKKNEQLMESYKDVVRKYNRLLDEYNKTKKDADANLYWHLKIFYEKYMIWRDFVEKKLRYYAKQRWVEKDKIRDEIYWWYKYSEDDDMKDAIDFVWKFIEEREKERQKEIDSIPF